MVGETDVPCVLLPAWLDPWVMGERLAGGMPTTSLGTPAFCPGHTGHPACPGLVLSDRAALQSHEQIWQPPEGSPVTQASWMLPSQVAESADRLIATGIISWRVPSPTQVLVLGLES